MKLVKSSFGKGPKRLNTVYMILSASKFIFAMKYSVMIVTANEGLICMAIGAGLGVVGCAFMNKIESKRLKISVLDCTKDKTDRHQYVWASRLGRDKPTQMKLFATYWIQKHKCNQGEALDALMNKPGLFLGEQGQVYKIS